METSELTFKKLGLDIRIPANAPNAGWFSLYYDTWEQESFLAIQNKIDSSKFFLDIGAWNGVLSMFAGQLCKGVIAIEADHDSVKELAINLALNNINHIIYNNAIYHENTKVKFGANQYRDDWDSLNQSVSQIHKDGLPSRSSYEITTITFDDIFYTYPIESIGLIKIDIEGGEEYILSDIVHAATQVPVLLSMHLDWWADEASLDTFADSVIESKLFCATAQDEPINPLELSGYVRKNPFHSIILWKP